MSPDAEGAYDVSTVRCYSCEAIARKSRAWAEGKGDSSGVYFRVGRSPTA